MGFPNEGDLSESVSEEERKKGERLAMIFGHSTKSAS